MQELVTVNQNLGEASRRVRHERDSMVTKFQARDLQIEEMHKAIYEEHIRGFEKAKRQIPYVLNMSIEGVDFDVMKDIYQGELVPLKEIPDEEFEADITVELSGEVADEGANGGADATGNPEG
ncbi:hypothetical protein VIGAN_05219500, partial [Vigna angularis var. angularis]